MVDIVALDRDCQEFEADIQSTTYPYTCARQSILHTRMPIPPRQGERAKTVVRVAFLRPSMFLSRLEPGSSGKEFLIKQKKKEAESWSIIVFSISVVPTPHPSSVVPMQTFFLALC